MVNSKLVAQIKPALREMLTESGWIEGPSNPKTLLFSTPLLNQIIPKNGNYQWLNNEIFVFEIVNLEPLSFIIKVIPGDTNTRSILVNTLSGLECLSTHQHKKPWVNYIGHKTNLTAANFAGKGISEIKDILKHDWGKITDIVNKVEMELVKHKSEFNNVLVNKSGQYPHWHKLNQSYSKGKIKVRHQPRRVHQHQFAA